MKWISIISSWCKCIYQYFMYCVILQGSYIFLEASSPRIQGDRAWLVSESFSTSSLNCLSFWYSMNGNGIGALRVWVWAQNGAQTPIWELKGRQGTSWLQGRVKIPAQTMQYKVIMTASK
jgi:hypothetical protein